MSERASTTVYLLWPLTLGQPSTALSTHVVGHHSSTCRAGRPVGGIKACSTLWDRRVFPINHQEKHYFALSDRIKYPGTGFRSILSSCGSAQSSQAAPLPQHCETTVIVCATQMTNTSHSSMVNSR